MDTLAQCLGMFANLAIGTFLWFTIYKIARFSLKKKKALRSRPSIVVSIDKRNDAIKVD